MVQIFAAGALLLFREMRKPKGIAYRSGDFMQSVANGN